MLVAGLAGGVLDKDECVNSEGAGAGVMISSCVVALALALMVLVLPAKPGTPEWATVFIAICVKNLYCIRMSKWTRCKSAGGRCDKEANSMEKM
jgi:hypothetical protein